jgi:hypothetical protein
LPLDGRARSVKAKKHLNQSAGKVLGQIPKISGGHEHRQPRGLAYEPDDVSLAAHVAVKAKPCWQRS